MQLVGDMLRLALGLLDGLELGDELGEVDGDTDGEAVGITTQQSHVLQWFNAPAPSGMRPPAEHISHLS